MSNLMTLPMGDVHASQLFDVGQLSSMEAAASGGESGSAADSDDDMRWYVFDADNLRPQPCERSVNDALDAAFGAANGGAIDLVINTCRYAGTVNDLRQFSDSAEGSYRAVRQMSRETASRYIPTFGLGLAQMGHGAPPKRSLGSSSSLGATQNSVPKTADEWKAAVDKIATRLAVRPFTSR